MRRTLAGLGFAACLAAVACLSLTACGGGGGGGDDGGGVTPPTYVLASAWVGAYFNPFSSDPGGDSDGGIFRAEAIQIGSDVTLTIYPDPDPQIIFTGTVSGATYTLTHTGGEIGGPTITETLTFTLSSASEGAGTVFWSESDGAVVTTGGGDIEIVKRTPPPSPVGGAWMVAITGNWSDPAGNEDVDETVPVAIVQNGDRFTINSGSGDPPIEGFVTGNQYLGASRNSWENGSGFTYVRFTVTSATAGTGTVRWTEYDAGNRVIGGANLAFSQ